MVVYSFIKIHENFALWKIWPKRPYEAKAIIHGFDQF